MSRGRLMILFLGLVTACLTAYIILFTYGNIGF